jgi:hypothetical protein
MVSELLDLGADANQDGGLCGNALQVAVAGGSIEIVQILLERCAIVNLVGGIHGSAIQAACLYGNRVILYLLSGHMTLNSLEDADPDLREISRLISLAAAAGHVGIMGVLLRMCGDRIRDIDLRDAMDAAFCQRRAHGCRAIRKLPSNLRGRE